MQERIIQAALLEIGTKETGDNNVKYNTEYYGRAVNGLNFSWCLVFIWYIFRKCGLSKLFYDGGRCASCTAFFKFHEKRGETIKSGFAPGDIVFYDWDKSGDYDHVGILAAIEGNKCMVIEGNTSTANNSNGGCVMLRERNITQIAGAVRPKYGEVKKVTDKEAYDILQQAQRYAAQLPAPEWALGELQEAVNAGITDGLRPMTLATRLESAIMAHRKITEV